MSPVFKKGKEEDPGNCLPGSLTSVPRKVMENPILEAISTNMEDIKVTRSSQDQFINGKWYLTNLIAFYNEKNLPKWMKGEQ